MDDVLGMWMGTGRIPARSVDLCEAIAEGAGGGVECLRASWEVPLIVLGGVGLLVLLWVLLRARKARESSPLLLFSPEDVGGTGTATVGTLGPRAGSSQEGGIPRRRDEGERRRSERPGRDRPPGQRAERGPEGVGDPPGVVSTEGDPSLPLVVGSATPSVGSARQGRGPVREQGGPRSGDPEGNGGGTVTFERPPDGTLQLLPGRLEVRSGPGTGEEIRFVRVPGAPPEVTFGRSPGPAYRHVQLQSLTVSREHARLVFRGGGWALRNESSTNPTVLNGRPLGAGPEEVDLEDGDEIEMGDIRFVFHHQQPRDRLPFRSSWYTDRGRRGTNQDAVVVRSLPGGREVAAVCDGIGSHAAGGIASHVALEALIEALSAGQGLADAVRKANRRIHAAGEGDGEREGMGTTLVALLRQGDRYHIANVGDSRAYRIDADGIRQLTRDHSFVAEAVQEGRMTAEEAVRSPWRNAVTRNLGTDPEVEVDVFGGFDATEGHLVVLCTDGVHGVLSDEEIEDVVRSTAEVADVARLLGERALLSGGEDNVAVAAMRFGGGVGSAGIPKDRGP